MANNLNVFHGDGILGIDAIKNDNGNGRGSIFFTLGMEQSWKNKDTGEWESRMDWVPVVYSRSTSDKLVASLTKLTPVRITGRIESYTRERNGEKTSVVQVRASEIQFLPRTRTNRNENDNDGGGSRPQRPQRQQRPSRRRQPEPDYDDEDEGWALDYDEE